ncbi:MAG: hydrogenase nickel incorporation protein HypB [Clostridia bacterium]|nr:hydrogenase nickel incorporation protein HypB [Clostridia bacterium]MBQ6557890.1 hydrogenase nickel incorporation protein HypB [Clostridia bacterium]MBQ9598987.1 hydrogenase nickel incorporation protein HypB [Clostridia bacterium]MBR0089256.1 hydrogenase nickel incorporation protein HypB [Clostridia bacterium]MBR0470028.1 hydrogenase nickel incorporation protein HypB [Clostridia bacterium]
MEIKVVHQILEWNEDVSDKVKQTLSDKKVCLVNVMGSPGAGKTSVITSIINKLSDKFRIGVIEGDIAGQIDAEKMEALGVPVVQLNTDGACHIEAMSILHILPDFDLNSVDVLFVENIGNLVCPAEFNIGEDFRVALLSVPEGDDKVHKYPLMFQTTDALVLNKYDMIEYFDFDTARVEKDARDINPDVSIFKVSNKSGDGLEEFLNWLSKKIEDKINA